MATRAGFATTVLAAMLALGAAPAVAQHMVTDREAGKLTLEALTATPIPVVHRIVYHPPRYETVRAVQAASYRRGGIRAATMIHLGSVRRRRRG